MPVNEGGGFVRSLLSNFLRCISLSGSNCVLAAPRMSLTRVAHSATSSPPVILDYSAGSECDALMPSLSFRETPIASCE